MGIRLPQGGMIGLRCIGGICKPDSGSACQIYSTIGQACPPSMMVCSYMYYGPMLCGQVQSEAYDE